MQAISLTLLVFLLLLARMPAQSAPKLSEDGKKAFEVLRGERTFSSEAVYVSGETPESVKAFRTLIREPDADGAFKRLLAEGTIPGQLYGLCGLFFTDHPYFLTAVERYRRRADTVPTQVGDLGVPMTIAEIVESNSPDAVRLKGPSQSISGWLNVNRKDSYVPDILGGGWAVIFKSQPRRN